ncbi:MAG: ubiquinol-cytochrome c reductase iron-sulfur subunit [Thermomicrobiales bacterium]|nr:ubiquinol-cytochrome c reductase iron-sulfur subunit [Thermomicrobiales bacterium]
MTRQHPRTAKLIKLFPRAWREHYQDEFLALIEDHPIGARDLLDIIVSAVDARVRPSSWLPGTERQIVLQSSGLPSPPQPGTTIRVGGDRPARPEHTRRFSRRVFLRNALVGSAAVALSGAGIATYAFTRPNKTGPFGQPISVPLSLLPAVGAPPYKDLQGKFWLINNDDGVLALYWTCPHLGCTVPWSDEEGRFHCPCHHSVYDRHGVRIEGPAPRPMDIMPIQLDTSGTLTINTGDIRQRADYDPSQSLKL